MQLTAILATAFKSILLNKVRSFLTMLGVIIGVGSVVLLTSIGTGLQAYVTNQFASLGTNTLYVTPGNPFGSGGGFSGSSAVAFTKPVLKRQYFNDVLRNNRDTVANGTYASATETEAKYKSITEKVTLYGTTSQYQFVRSTKAQKGAWFTAADEAQGARVAVLGPDIASKLFGQADPINRSIKINGTSYTVIGETEKKGGGLGGPTLDAYVYVPIDTLFNNFNVDLINGFVFEARDKDTIAAAKAGIEQSMLDEKLKKDDFTVFDQSELLTTINSILGVLTAGLGGIAAISLLVGGIGIMNIMLVSVTERTREIGLRKALGATPNLILLQFLIEAALLSITGGLIGLGIAFLGSLAIQSFFPAQVTWQAVTIAFGVSTVVGLVFGAAPARRAANLSPIEALRYE